MTSPLLGPVGLGMCPPSKVLLSSHIRLHHWISKTDNDLEEESFFFFFFPQHLLLPPKLTIVPNGKEMR